MVSTHMLEKNLRSTDRTRTSGLQPRKRFKPGNVTGGFTMEYRQLGRSGLKVSTITLAP